MRKRARVSEKRPGVRLARVTTVAFIIYINLLGCRSVCRQDASRAFTDPTAEALRCLALKSKLRMILPRRFTTRLCDGCLRI